MKTPTIPLRVKAHYFDSAEGPQITPYIKIAGTWLEEFGFFMDLDVTVTLRKGFLLVELDEEAHEDTITYSNETK